MTALSQTSDLDVPARLRDPETLQDSALLAEVHEGEEKGEEKPERPVFRSALSLRTFERSPVAL
ncbi:hypothetical protein [Streptomyces jumonjinensis]|uniref:Uncharacterized protein n=1 Tax=Streptomyces jumonjinensis TaxID=1945 RepID=A0A646KKC1_STRJU|nr:hypothetical protein [Streptomyces jumonjinensis]MQT01496.1 hypothetical protein [Streptomyces jumonjinensis]